LTAVFATAALLPDADLFSFVMTESLTFCLYSLASLALIRSIKAPGLGGFLVAGALLGLLVLTRAAYAALIFVVPLLIFISFRRGERLTARAAGHVAALLLACAAVVGPWMVRNALSVGHWGLTEEYGSAALIERFAFNDMTAREFWLAFPYCLPAIGPPLVHAAFGQGAMDRFVYYTPKSFFHAGRLTRDKLVEAHGRLDPLIGGLVLNEMQNNWWRHLLVSVPMGW
jgi:4-amino-4-deoxy-L-arabinose transferase-like glycosyltransferase